MTHRFKGRIQQKARLCSPSSPERTQRPFCSLLFTSTARSFTLLGKKAQKAGVKRSTTWPREWFSVPLVKPGLPQRPVGREKKESVVTGAVWKHLPPHLGPQAPGQALRPSCSAPAAAWSVLTALCLHPSPVRRGLFLFYLHLCPHRPDQTLART